MIKTKTHFNGYQLQVLSYCETVQELLWALEDLQGLPMYSLKSIDSLQLENIIHDIELMGMKSKYKGE